MAETTAVAEKKAFTTSLSEWSNAMTGLIIDDYKACGMNMDDYAKECAMEAMTSIFNLVKSDPKINMGKLDTSNLRGIVKRCASLKLNASKLFLQLTLFEKDADKVSTGQKIRFFINPT